MTNGRYINKRSHLLDQHAHHQIIYFLLSLEDNEYAGIKYPIKLKQPKKLLLMRMLTQRVEK